MIYNHKEMDAKWQQFWLFFVFIFFFGQTTFAQKTDWEEMNINGKIKSYETTFFDKNRNIEYIVQYFFNEKGNITKNYVFNLNQYGEKIIALISEYQYNEKDEKKQQTTHDSNNNLTDKSIYTYKGNKIEQIWYKKDQFYTKTITEYNKNGNITAFFSYDENNQLKGRSIYNYNEKYQITEEIGYDANNTIIWKSDYKRNEKGQILECFINQSDGLIYKYLFIYDPHGNWTKKEIYKNNELTEIQERKIEYYN